jgi:hypothetical protein
MADLAQSAPPQAAARPARRYPGWAVVLVLVIVASLVTMFFWWLWMPYLWRGVERTVPPEPPTRRVPVPGAE